MSEIGLIWSRIIKPKIISTWFMNAPLGHLRASGFVRAKGQGDIKDLNQNSENWAVIKASLTAGLYPNIAFQSQNQICAHSHGPVNMQDSVIELKDVDENVQKWFVYEQYQDKNIKGITMVNPITVFLFAGHNRLPTEYIQECTQGIYFHFVENRY